MKISDICIVLALVFLGGLCSLCETAISTSRRSRLRTQLKEKDKRHEKIAKILEKPGRLLLSLHVSIGLLDIGLGIMGAIFFVEHLKTWFLQAGVRPSQVGVYSYILMILILIILHTLFAITIPRRIARSNPEKIVIRFVPLVSIIPVMLYPLLFVLDKISRFTLILFRVREGEKSGITEDELHLALIEGEKSGIVESEERTMVEGVFYLGDRRVGAFMTPRQDIAWLELDANATEAKAIVEETMDQRYFPVAGESLDNIVGIVSSEDILLSLLENWQGLEKIMKPPLFIPETISALRAFEFFKKGTTDFLLVIDEYGGLAGILSMRNLIEEIVGELSAPEDDKEIRPQEDGTYIVDGMVNIDELAETLSIYNLPGEEHEYHTLAGFILELAEEIPKAGEVYEWHGFRFKILLMDGNRIDKILITPPPHQP